MGFTQKLNLPLPHTCTINIVQGPKSMFQFEGDQVLVPCNVIIWDVLMFMYHSVRFHTPLSGVYRQVYLGALSLYNAQSRGLSLNIQSCRPL